MTTFFDLPVELRQMIIIAAFTNAEEEDRTAILAIMISAAALAREDRSNIIGFAQVRRTNNSNDTQNHYRVQPLRRIVAVEALIKNIIAAPLSKDDKIKLGSDVSWVIGQWTAASDKPDVELYRILRDEFAYRSPGLMPWVAGYAD